MLFVTPPSQVGRPRHGEAHRTQLAWSRRPHRATLQGTGDSIRVQRCELSC